MTKPKIVRCDGRWICREVGIVGIGCSPKIAYEDWFTRFHNLTRIPRRGVWNRQSARDWYRRGCPRSSHYVTGADGRLKKIVGYDPTRDELILQG